MSKDLVLEFELKNTFEKEFRNKGLINILGIDEVGRGPLAGGVIVGGVVLNPEIPIYGLDDSKRLTEKKREQLAKEIRQKAWATATVEVTAPKIDQLGIGKAITQAINGVIKKIAKQIKIDAILIDYLKHQSKYPTLSITKGDQKSNSIAAAAIIAKVYRDKKMKKLGVKYPDYKFEKNKGYGTTEHRRALAIYGPIPKIHRYSFEPIKSQELR